MPGHRQPMSLEGLSLGRVCQHLDSTCRRLQMISQETSASQVLTIVKQTIRPYYINGIPARLRCRIIEETSRMLYGPASDGSTLISGPAPLYLLAILLGHDIRQLKVNLCCYYGCSHQTSLLKLLSNEGIGLESLELARSALLRLDCKLLRSSLMNMKNLLSLTLRNIANDSVLQIIGKSCPKLVILDVACSMQVTDLGLKQLLLQVELRDKVMANDLSIKHQQQKQQQQLTSWSRLKTLLKKFKLKKHHRHHHHHHHHHHFLDYDSNINIINNNINNYNNNDNNDKNKNNINSNKKYKLDKSDYNNESVLLEYCENKNSLCDSLKVLNIANTGITSAGVLLALANIPNLESLADYNHMGRVVEIMNRGVIELKTPFNLKQVKSSRTTQARLELLADTCPNLEKLNISEPHHPPEILCLFKNVTSLTISSIPCRKEWLSGFNNYLNINGHCLRELNIRLINQNDLPLLQLDLRQIFINCPNLITLTEDGGDIVWLEGQDPPQTLKYLKKIQLGRTITATTITKILLLTPNLNSLHVHTCFDLTDQHLENLINYSPSNFTLNKQHDNSNNNNSSSNIQNSLIKNLSCFYVYEASKISATTVLNMFKSCQKLRKIGNLSNWGIDCEGIQMLKTTLERANLDIDLCPGSHWFWSHCIH